MTTPFSITNSGTLARWAEAYPLIRFSPPGPGTISFVAPLEDKKTITNGRFMEFISSLPDDTLTVKKPIPVVVEYDLDGDTQDHEFVVVFKEAGIAMSGDTVRDAFRGFKDEIVDIFHIYRRESALGPEPKRRLAILEQYIGKKGGE